MRKAVKTTLKPTPFLMIILFLQLLLYFSIFFHFPIVRQIVGFIYLTFAPGFVMTKFLKLDKLDFAENILFSSGLSIALLMVIGLFLNGLGPLIGVQQPLALTSLLIATSSFVLVGTVLYYLKNTRSRYPNKETERIPLRSLFLILLPILSVIGTFWANTTGNSSILLFAIFATAVAFCIVAFSTRLIMPKLYAIVVFAIAISLLFHASLTSNYIYGSDIHIEYYLFRLTQKNAYWNLTAYFTDPAYGMFNTMLSITVLPTIYSNVLNMEATWILKVVFPLMFAFVPLALYKMWEIKLGIKPALFSAFLLMSQYTFYIEMLGLARQMIAELFFVLLFFVLFSEKLSPMNRKICFIIFSFALVASHYSMAFIFLFFISTAWLFMYLFKKKWRNLTISMIALFFSMMFVWYIYTSSAASFEGIVQFVDWIYRGLGNFLNPTARGKTVLLGLGMEPAQSFWQLLSRIVAYITEFFIVIGFLVIIIQRKKTIFGFEYVILWSSNMIVLAMCILLPNFASSLQMTRFYHILLFFLASLFVIGCKVFVEFIARTKKEFFSSVFIVILLVTYFLFQIGFVYEVTGSQSWSVPLSRYRLGPRLHTEFGFVTEQEVVSAEWLSQHVNMENLVVHADWHIFSALVSYGSIYREKLRVLTNITNIGSHEFVYLGELNVVYGKVVENDVWNTSDILGYKYLSPIYTNGNSVIYENTTIHT